MAKELKNEQEFEALVAEGKPMVVDFGAEWCGPCKMIAPIIDELAEEFDGRVNVVKVDVDAADGLAGRFGIRNVPTILFFKDGEVVNKLVGANPKPKISKEIENLL